MAHRGHFVWEELTTTDLASAAAFYSKIAGINTEPAPGDPSYTLLVASAGRMGGLMALGAGAKLTNASPIWLSYILTLDVEETVRQAESLGGTVVRPPAAMGDGGRFAILQDPQGAVFAVYASPRPSEPRTAVPLGGMSWHELVSTDYEAAFNFYQALFGWHVVNDMDMGPSGMYRLFAAGGASAPLGGMYTKSPQQPGPLWLPYIEVADVAASTTLAKARGAQIMHGPHDVPGGRITIGTDLQGAMFAMHQTVAAPSTATAAPKRRAKPAAKAGRKAAPKRKTSAATKKAAPKKKKVAPKKRKAGSKK